ncbi:MAG: hypothetical protein U1F60_03985 [Planctomycetota bacterium]
MNGLGELSRQPLVRLRCSRSDRLRSLLERQPTWAHASPSHQQQHGDRAVTCYRLAPESFFLQVHWRRVGEEWQERDVEFVPGAAVALRLVLDAVEPAWITRTLELPPTRAFARGETGRRQSDEGLWIHEVWPGSFRLCEEKLAELLALLRARAGLRHVLGHRGVRWAGVTVKLRGAAEHLGGLVLDAPLLADLAGLSLAFDLELAAD